MKRVKILEAEIDNFEPDEILYRIKEFVRSGRPHSIITANSLMVDCISRDGRLKKAFDKADLVLTDSIGIVWAARYLGNPALHRMPGIDLMLKMCSMAESRNYNLYLLGAHESIVKKAAENLRQQFPSINITGVHHGYFAKSLGEEDRIIKKIKETRPDILFVGMAVPHQEKWINEHLEELGVPVCMGVGGSFDVISGRFERAPRWVRMKGLEWVHRFLLQPWRIIRLIKLPVFVFKVFLQKHFSR